MRDTKLINKFIEQSQRKWKELHDEYQNRKELTVKETADKIGFRLPQEPKIK